MLEQLGIQLIRLDLPFRLNHVNCFIAEGEDGHLVIDTGLHNEKTIKRWNDELQQKSVTDIFVTHHHPDHFGYAGRLQQKLNARVTMSEIEYKMGTNMWQKKLLDKLTENYKHCAIPDDISKQMYENTKDFIPLVTPYPTVHRYFQEYERVKIGNFEYEVLFTPGHSDGLISFYNAEKKVLISTDHILPRITPNISYWFVGDDNPLKTYLASLDKVKQLDIDYVIPSHGKPFYDGGKRIAKIIEHHDNRLNETLAAVKQHSTIYNICQQLFQFELTIHETRFAIGETIAHLEYLRDKGILSRTK